MSDLKATPTVFVVDDDPAVRDGFVLLFDAAGISVESYASAEAFLAAYDAERPGCLVLDVNMPGMTGTELHEELCRLHSQMPIIFLTAYGDIPMTVRAIKAGAIEFLTKPVQGPALIEHVTTALVLDEQRRKKTQHDRYLSERLASLSQREKDILRLAVAGRANKEIARELGISFRTVEIHRSHIRDKTGCHTLLELARLADEAAEIEAVRHDNPGTV
jgi:FixJ family two-component response regulator